MNSIGEESRIGRGTLSMTELVPIYLIVRLFTVQAIAMQLVSSYRIPAVRTLRAKFLYGTATFRQEALGKSTPPAPNPNTRLGLQMASASRSEDKP